MDVRELGALALVIVVASIIISMGATILGQLKLQQTDSSLEANVTNQGLAGMVTFGNWIPLIALVIAASIVIGVIVKYLGGVSGGV